MPRHPETLITPNTVLAERRAGLPSPRRPGQRMSRAELADAVNAALDRLYPGRSLTAHYVDYRWVGKLERGEHRWPSRERRAALREVLGAATDADLGLYSPRRTADLSSPRGLKDQPGIGPSTHINDQLLYGDLDAWRRELDQLIAQPTRTWPELGVRVREHLDILERLQRDGARSHLAPIDARWSEFMSWIADNTLTHPDGAAWLDRSHHRAAQADDRPLTAYTLMRRSQRALDNGDIRAAISLHAGP